MQGAQSNPSHNMLAPKKTPRAAPDFLGGSKKGPENIAYCADLSMPGFQELHEAGIGVG